MRTQGSEWRDRDTKKRNCSFCSLCSFRWSASQQALQYVYNMQEFQIVQSKKLEVWKSEVGNLSKSVESSFRARIAEQESEVWIPFIGCASNWLPRLLAIKNTMLNELNFRRVLTRRGGPPLGVSVLIRQILFIVLVCDFRNKGVSMQ